MLQQIPHLSQAISLLMHTIMQCHGMFMTFLMHAVRIKPEDLHVKQKEKY